MGLLDLKTDLKSLKFQDPPYITKDIGQDSSGQIQRRLDDVSRLAQMLVDKPGLKYLGNEALLYQFTPEARESGNLLSRLGKTLLQTGKLVTSTLAQTGVNGTGLHFLKAFRTDTYVSDGSKGSSLERLVGIGGVEGAPLALNGATIIPDNPGDDPKFAKKYKSKHVSYTDATGIVGSGDGKTLFDSKFDLKGTPTGITSPFLLDNVSPFSPDKSVTGSFAKPLPQTEKGNVADTSQSLIKKISYSDARFKPTTEEIVSQDTHTVNTIQDFRYENDPKNPNTYKGGYTAKKVNRETRVNLGNQGEKKGVNEDYSNIKDSRVDTINSSDIQNGDRLVGSNEGRDFAKFFFEIITPEDSKFIHFRAHIDSISDDYSGNWAETSYVGRAEKFFTYEGFGRSMNVSFKIAASSRSEMKPLYRKMVMLASTTAPTYNKGGLMRGTFVRMTIGSYIYQVPGVLTGVRYDWKTEYPWEIAMQSPEGTSDNDMQELPMIMDCSLTFKPVHDFTPVTGLRHYITNPNPNNTVGSFLK